MNDNSLMKFDPAYGTERPYPSQADQYRAHHGNIAWLFNPYTGDKRHPLDIGSDPFGHLVMAPGQLLGGSLGACAGQANQAGGITWQRQELS